MIGCTCHYCDSDAQMVDQSFLCNLWVLVVANVAQDLLLRDNCVSGVQTTPHHFRVVCCV